MHIPKAFELTDPKEQQKLVDDYPLATVINLSDKGTNMAAEAQHIPLYWHTDNNGKDYLHGHIARANPLREETLAPDTLCIFQGPQAYITPNWYPTKKQHGKAVPTWNYVALHIRGTMNFIEDKNWKLAMLSELTRKMEVGIEKHQQEAWELSDAPADYIEKMLQGIIGIEMTIESVVGQCKLSQNQPMINFEGVIRGLGQSQQSAATQTMTAMNAQKNQ